MKRPHCESKKLEYYPDVDRASWVSHIYTMNEDGKWKIKVWSDGLKDVSTITTGDIFDEDEYSRVSYELFEYTKKNLSTESEAKHLLDRVIKCNS